MGKRPQFCQPKIAVPAGVSDRRNNHVMWRYRKGERGIVVPEELYVPLLLTAKYGHVLGHLGDLSEKSKPRKA